MCHRDVISLYNFCLHHRLSRLIFCVGQSRKQRSLAAPQKHNHHDRFVALLLPELPFAVVCKCKEFVKLLTLRGKWEDKVVSFRGLRSSISGQDRKLCVSGNALESKHEVSFMGQIATPVSTVKSAVPMSTAQPVGRILVVEDDPAVQKALKRLFESEGYVVEVQGNGQSALESFQAAPPAVIILDLRLPKLSGSDLCKEIKTQAPTLPIVVLSATSDVSDKVLLLELGADDYVTKPFSPRELLARVRAALRHTLRRPNVTVVSFDDITIDFKKMEVQRSGKVVILTAQEFKTLKFLLENADRVISRDELLNDVWGYQNYPSTRTVDNHILKLRQKLERDPASPVHFRTVHGMGYKFVR